MHHSLTHQSSGILALAIVKPDCTILRSDAKRFQRDVFALSGSEPF